MYMPGVILLRDGVLECVPSSAALARPPFAIPTRMAGRTTVRLFSLTLGERWEAPANIG